MPQKNEGNFEFPPSFFMPLKNEGNFEIPDFFFDAQNFFLAELLPILCVK